MATDPKKDTTQQTEETTGWRPETGDILTGTVTEISKGWSDYADAYYPIVGIRTENGSIVNVHCFHEILKERMLDARPEIGSELEIECLGEKKTRDGKRSYVAYRVTVPGETGARVWDDLSSGRSKAAASATPTSGTEDDIPF